jgi:RND family efflux transporter MFP subunit
MSRARLAALVLVLLAAACGRGGGAGQDRVPAVVGAGTVVAVEQPFAVTVEAIGAVVPRPGTFARLSAPGATRVARVFVAPGDVVKPGTALVEFERAPFEAAAHSAEASLSAAQRAYDRAERLAQGGVLARKDVDQAATELAQAQSAAVVARRNQELATLRAPVAGVVIRMTAVLGASVDVSEPLVEVANPAALDVVVNLSPAEAARVRPGAAAQVTAGEGAGGEMLGGGTVTAVGAEVDSTSRTVAVRAHLSRPARALRIGETVFARITVAVHPKAVTIPAASLVPEGEGFKVFVVGSDGLAHARAVTVGARRDSLVEVTSGLAGGETVVSYGAYGVQDSARVVRARP